MRGAALKVLFIHWLFPCQFRYLAPALKAQGHDVRAIMDVAEPVPEGFDILRYAAPDIGEGVHHLSRYFNLRMSCGEAVARQAEALARTGFTPDLIIGHYGKGECLFIKDVFPGARFICYADIFFRMEDTLFDAGFADDSLAARMRNTAVSPLFLTTAARADALWAATHWQAQTYPDLFADRTHVVFDGIDCDRCAPSPDTVLAIPNKGLTLRQGDEILLFAARNLEPARGYHRFMRVLPEIMRRRPNLQVLIAGGHGVTYSDPPPQGGSWKSVFLREVQGSLDPARTHMLGSVPYDTFLDLLRIARAQLYFTQPYILSWSFFEAMSCGALMIGSRGGPVEEVLEDGVNGRLVDLFDDNDIIETTVDALARPDAHQPLREQARKTMLARYDGRRVCLPQQLELVRKVMG
jgi:glycosyltransferase involved in cell wall biosynthesis